MKNGQNTVKNTVKKVHSFCPFSTIFRLVTVGIAYKSGPNTVSHGPNTGPLGHRPLGRVYRPH